MNLIPFVLLSPWRLGGTSLGREDGTGEDKNFHEALLKQQATGKGTDPEMNKDRPTASQSHSEGPRTLAPYSGLLDTLATGRVLKSK